MKLVDNSYKTLPEISVDVLATDSGDSADCCVFVERTVLASFSAKKPLL